MARAGIDSLGRNASTRPRGLHVFSVEPRLAVASLAALRRDSRFLPEAASLKAAIHEGDVALGAAYTELGAPTNGPSAIITLGRHAANYTLRTLPALRREQG
jgi:hypothetical protein